MIIGLIKQSIIHSEVDLSLASYISSYVCIVGIGRYVVV